VSYHKSPIARDVGIASCANTKGIELVKSGQYRYISPAWGTATDNSGKQWPAKLLTISLTNTPAFEGTLEKLQNQLELSKENLSNISIAM
jgi:phage I-like protein